MDRSELIVMARLKAQSYGLEPDVICALVEQESGWDTNAKRFEPAFKTRYIDKLGLSEPEATERATSYGLCQVMGEVAREFGLLGDLPSQLCDPDIGLEYGCKVFAHKLAVNLGSIPKALEAYNGGNNPAYAPQVLARTTKYEQPDEG